MLRQHGLTLSAALTSACELGHNHVVEYLLEKGADVNRADVRQSTPALDATAKDHFEILQTLIAAGARLDVDNAKGDSVLEVAMSKCDASTVQLILKTLGGPDYPLESVSLEIASAKRPETMRSLMKSASFMHAQLVPNTGLPQKYAWVKWVLKSGGDLVKPRALFNMMLIATSDANCELVRTLLQNGADPGMSFLGAAVVNQHLDLVELLLDYGAGLSEPDRRFKYNDDRQENILDDALLNMPYCTESCREILRLLLDSGRFDILAGPSSNQTAFWRVLESDNWDADLRNQVAFVMLDPVVDVNYACDGDGGTPMHHVVRFGHENMVNF